MTKQAMTANVSNEIDGKMEQRVKIAIRQGGSGGSTEVEGRWKLMGWMGRKKLAEEREDLDLTKMSDWISLNSTQCRPYTTDTGLALSIIIICTSGTAVTGTC